MNVTSWPVWEKGVSEFPWHYEDSETCFLLTGKVEVLSADGVVEFGAGDLVTFPRGLRCTWRIKEAVRKHFRFGTR